MRSTVRPAAETTLVILSALALFGGAACAGRTMLQQAAAPAASSGAVTEVTWHVTVGSKAPDCFQRDVLLVNGTFQPTLEVTQGDFLKVRSICASSNCSWVSES